MTILMGRWDCGACGNKGVRGDAYNCSGCGAGRPDDVEFYLPSNAEVITDSAGIRAANAGSDWKCDYCGDWVPATESQCPDCRGGTIGGAERQETSVASTAAAFRRRVEETREEFEPSLEKTVRSIASPSRPEPMRNSSSYRRRYQSSRRTAVATPNKSKFIAPAIVLSVLLLSGLGIWALVRSTDVLVTVSSHSWQRVQNVEEFKTGILKEGWSHPGDAYEVARSNRIHHYNKVFSHTERESYTERERYQSGTQPVYSTRTVNLGNGRFRQERYQSGTRPTYSYRNVTKYRNKNVYREEPEYRTYYHYKVDRWVGVSPRVTSGAGLDPQWPSAEVAHDKQRMGSRNATYTLILRTVVDEGEQSETHNYEVNEAEWRSFHDNQTLIAEISVAKGVEKLRDPTLEVEQE